jgi:hypothetical protein
MATQAGKLRHTLVARKALLPLNLFCASLTDFFKEMQERQLVTTVNLSTSS